MGLGFYHTLRNPGSSVPLDGLTDGWHRPVSQFVDLVPPLPRKCVFHSFWQKPCIHVACWRSLCSIQTVVFLFLLPSKSWQRSCSSTKQEHPPPPPWCTGTSPAIFPMFLTLHRNTLNLLQGTTSLVVKNYSLTGAVLLISTGLSDLHNSRWNDRYCFLDRAMSWMSDCDDYLFHSDLLIEPYK